MIALYLAKCNKQNEHAVAKALAEYGFRRCFGRNAKIIHDACGKPYFNREAAAFVSLSHTEGICLAAISDREIGADIEYMKGDSDRLLRLAKRYFTEPEAEYVSADPHRRFYEVWCKKESYIKYTGEGMSRPLGSFSVSDIKRDGKGIIFSSLVTDNYTIAVCAHEAVIEPPITVEDITIIN